MSHAPADRGDQIRDGQYRKPTVYEAIVEYSQQHRQESDEHDDVVTYTRERKFVHILARSPELARAAWEFDNLYPDQTHAPELISMRPLCNIDLFCDVSRGGSF